MNNSTQMSFGGFIWKNNPSDIKIEYTHYLIDDTIPFNKGVLQDIAIKRRIISGSGEFFGENCFEQFSELHKLFEDGSSAILYIPNTININAKLHLLEVTKTNIKDVIGYKFEFWEDFNTSDIYKDNFTIAKNECLWDIANRLNISIDNLVALNPNIKRPDLILQNKRVHIL